MNSECCNAPVVRAPDRDGWMCESCSVPVSRWCAWCGVWSDHQSGYCPVLEADRQKMRAWAATTELPDYMTKERKP